MLRPRFSVLLVLAALLAVPVSAGAGHHRWSISEIYSDATGTIQYVELYSQFDNEQGFNGFNVETFGTIPTTASLSPNLPSSATADTYALVATAGYATLATQQGAPAPDRVLPDNFLQLDADTVRYAGISGTDESYTAGQLPVDGVNALNFEDPNGPSVQTNSPENFAGDSGSIDASAASVPALPRAGLVLLIGTVVLSSALLLRRLRAVETR